MNYTLYRITNLINQKCYIGVTTDTDRRFRQHQSGVGSKALKNAIRKHGEENFLFEELVCAMTEEEAYELEIQMIREHGSYRYGYNNTKGGEGRSGHVGESCHLSKLTEDSVIQLIADPCSHKIAAKKYNINYTTVQDVRSGKSWPHLNRRSAPKYESAKMVVDEITATLIIHDPLPHVEVADRYGVSVANVRAIRYGKSWKNLDRSNAPEYRRASRWDVNTRQASAAA